MPGRSFVSEAYRYGYQGSERDPEMSGGAGYTTFFRALDPRIGRWLTPDPKVFPWQSPYVSMDANPIALNDPWGAETGGDTNPLGEGNEITVVGNAPQTPGASSSAFEPSTVCVGALTPIPLVNAFRNDATQVVNHFIPDLVTQGIRSAQVIDEYDSSTNWLSQALSQLDNILQGSGDKTNWNGNGLLQLYRKGGGVGRGQAIQVKGYPTLTDVETVPGQLGVGFGFGKGRIGYLGMGNGATVGINILGAAGMGAKSFQIGYNSNLLDFAIKAVKGDVGGGSKPVIKVVNSKQINSQTDKIKEFTFIYDVNTTTDTLNVYYMEWENEGVFSSILVFPNDTIVKREVNLKINKSRTVKIYPSR